MNILSIDIGTYSIKFVESLFERKSLIHLSTHQIVIDDYSENFPKEITQEEVQFEIIKEYLKKRKYDGRIIMQYPAKYLTSRFLTLPVINRKKAEMMIPFQLDKNLLFPASETHYSAMVTPNRSSTYAVVSAAELAQFDSYFKKLEGHSILPETLTSELSLVQSYVQARPIEGTCCLLDIGHETSKAYIVSGRRILSSHISYFAGRVIDEVIEETYKISHKEAIQFKLQNSFVLKEEQYADVDKDQQEFAKLMKKIFTPLLEDFRKWELGTRVNYGYRINTLYIYGGVSNMRNMANFLAESLSIKTELFDAFGTGHLPNLHLNHQDRISFANAQLMALSSTFKVNASNLLSGNYASAYHEEIPLHSAAFIGVRVIMVTAVILFSLFLERLFISRNHNFYDQKITKLMKMDELQIPKREQRRYKTHPEAILTLLKNKMNELEQQANFIQASSKLNALTPLLDVTKQLRPSANWEMIRMDYTQGGAVTIGFQGQNLAVLSELKDQARNLPYEDIKVLEDNSDQSLTLEFTLPE